jgi:charged multivesicular body protein 1
MSAATMEKHMFNLKFASKQLLRDSKKAEKEEKAEKNKLKKAIEKGNMDVARIHAENAIRQKNQSLNYLRMSARIDAVSSRVQTAITTKRVTSSMSGVVKAMDGAMKSMNLEKISGKCHLPPICVRGVVHILPFICILSLIAQWCLCLIYF